MELLQSSPVFPFSWKDKFLQKAEMEAGAELAVATALSIARGEEESLRIGNLASLFCHSLFARP